MSRAVITADQVIGTIHARVLGLHEPFLQALPCVDSAIARVQQYVFGREICPTMAEKALAYLKLARRHCFPDANKRTALAAMLSFLRLNGLGLYDAEGPWSNDKCVSFVVDYADSAQSEERADEVALQDLRMAIEPLRPL